MPDDVSVDVVYLRPTQPTALVERIALIGGLVAAVALAGLVGWLGFRTYKAQDREAQRSLFVQAAQDIAVNLSTARSPTSASNRKAVNRAGCWSR
jgi:Mce-associated membrane protein